VGLGSYIPDYVLTNAELEQYVDTSDEWIVQRTGIRERRIAKGKATWELALSAAEAALSDAGITAAELDLIVVTTVTPDTYTPTVSCTIQDKLGAVNAAAFDLNAACSGFVYGVELVDSYIRAGKKKAVLVVSAENLHRVIDFTDRTTCILFGDGAGAAVFVAEEVPDNEEAGVLSTFSAADGALREALYIEALPLESDPFGPDRPQVAAQRYLRMNGKDVYRFTAWAVPNAIEKVLEQTGKSATDVDWFVLHQANSRILNMVARRYGLDSSKVYVNINRFGNTSSASVPLCLAEMKQKGLLQKGQLVLMAGFGGGLTYGSALLRL